MPHTVNETKGLSLCLILARRGAAVNEFFGTTMPKLGFGLMRLPRLADGKTIDIEQCEAMTDAFLDAGMRYFDTAYVYEGSEEATRRFLVKRHPRESFYLADKVNASPWAAKSADEAKRELAVSLERTGSRLL
jgi:predicted aldo/keto reductase-like oxidoreductase